MSNWIPVSKETPLAMRRVIAMSPDSDRVVKYSFGCQFGGSKSLPEAIRDDFKYEGLTHWLYTADIKPEPPHTGE